MLVTETVGFSPTSFQALGVFLGKSSTHVPEKCTKQVYQMLTAAEDFFRKLQEIVIMLEGGRGGLRMLLYHKQKNWTAK